MISPAIITSDKKPNTITKKFVITQVEGIDWTFCPIRKKAVKITGHPEEIVRQQVLYELHDIYGYPWECIDVEVSVTVGSSESKKRADIVVYSDSYLNYPRIFIEVKKPERHDGLEQLKVYMNATGCRLGMWCNGTDPRVNLLRIEPTALSEKILWREIRNIPAKNENLEDVDNPITRSDLHPVADFLSILRDCEDFIKAHEGNDAFNEIFKLVVAKLFDERRTLKNDSSVARFRIGALEAPSKAQYRIVDLFRDATELWSGIFTTGESILLGEDSLAYCVSALQRIYLLKSDADILGSAFEIMINPSMKGDKGQYFTPRHVIQMCTMILDPKDNETVFDPACGSGGFLVGALEHVFDKIREERDDESEILDNQKDYANTNVFGIDYDPLVAKVAKAYMLIWGDGRANICVADGLNETSWNNDARAKFLVKTPQGNFVPREFDVIMTNPPFAGAISSSGTLSRYTLARKPAGGSQKGKRFKPLTRVNRDILFIERCIKSLRPGGRMAIVLPRGIFKNYGDEYIREFILKHTIIRAVVGLSGAMFKPFTNTKTCILFVQKRQKEIQNVDQAKDDPSIIFAVTERPGKDRSGKIIRHKDGTIDSDLLTIGSYIRDNISWENYGINS